MEIIRLEKGSNLPVKRTQEEFEVPRSSFYRWYRVYSRDGFQGLMQNPSQQRRYWDRIPGEKRKRVVEETIGKPELSPWESAWCITDAEGRFISESGVYRILKGCDLVTRPNCIVIPAADEFRLKTRRVYELWQTDFSVPQKRCERWE